MLIAVGLYVGMIKRIFMDRKEPSSAWTSVLGLRPFDFWTAFDFVRSQIGVPPKDFVELYSTLGGMPRYLLYVSRYYRRDSVEVLRGLFFDEFAPLREESLNVLRLEFGRFHHAHFLILEAVSLGYVTPKDISDKTGIKLLTVKVVYRISEEFFNFWFRFIYHNYTALGKTPRGSLGALKLSFQLSWVKPPGE